VSTVDEVHVCAARWTEKRGVTLRLAVPVAVIGGVVGSDVRFDLHDASGRLRATCPTLEDTAQEIARDPDGVARVEVSRMRPAGDAAQRLTNLPVSP
jgi:hypothetical protein